MAIQYEMEALIVDTPLRRVYQLIGTKPQTENEEKIMPPVLTSLVRTTLSSCSRGHDKAKQNKPRKKRKCSRYPRNISFGVQSLWNQCQMSMSRI